MSALSASPRATRSWFSWDTSCPVTPSPRVRQSGTLPYSSTTGEPLPVWYSACPCRITCPADGSQVSVPPPCPRYRVGPGVPQRRGHRRGRREVLPGHRRRRRRRRPRPGPGRGGRGKHPGPPRRHRPGRHHGHDAQGHPAGHGHAVPRLLPRPPGIHPPDCPCLRAARNRLAHDPSPAMSACRLGRPVGQVRHRPVVLPHCRSALDLPAIIGSRARRGAHALGERGRQDRAQSSARPRGSAPGRCDPLPRVTSPTTG